MNELKDKILNIKAAIHLITNEILFLPLDSEINYETLSENIYKIDDQLELLHQSIRIKKQLSDEYLKER